MAHQGQVPHFINETELKEMRLRVRGVHDKTKTRTCVFPLLHTRYSPQPQLDLRRKKNDLVCLKFAYYFSFGYARHKDSLEGLSNCVWHPPIFPPNTHHLFPTPKCIQRYTGQYALDQSKTEKSDEVGVPKSKPAGTWIRITLSCWDSNTLRTLVLVSISFKSLGFLKDICIKIVTSLHSCQILMHTVPLKPNPVSEMVSIRLYHGGLWHLRKNHQSENLKL